MLGEAWIATCSTPCWSAFCPWPEGHLLISLPPGSLLCSLRLFLFVATPWVSGHALCPACLDTLTFSSKSMAMNNICMLSTLFSHLYPCPSYLHVAHSFPSNVTSSEKPSLNASCKTAPAAPYTCLALFYLLAVLGLCCYTQAFSSGERGLLTSCGTQASHWGGSHVVEHGLCACRQASAVVALRLNFPEVCGIFPDQELNLCPLHWQADS